LLKTKSGKDRKMNPRKLNKYDKAYLRIATEWGLLSYCKRRQVGAIIVKDRMIISDGYNGTPSGFENCCEDELGLTRWDVLHAEANAILKVARSTQSCEGATLYITLSPCKECSKLIYQSGIKRVVYHQGYRDDSGIQFLIKAGVEVEQITNFEQ
jgi:dCMP deaminase